jgi:hypothetical protein
MQHDKETYINRVTLIYKSVGKLGGDESVCAVCDGFKVTKSWSMTPCNFAEESDVSHLTVEPESEDVHNTDSLCLCTNCVEQNYSRVLSS